MKKVLFGCLALVVILGIGGAIGAYYFVWRPAKAYVADLGKLKEYTQLNQQVKKTAAFTPPSDNLLSKDTVDRFLKTQQAVQTGLGPRVVELEAKYKAISDRVGPNGRASIPELITAFRDMVGLILEAKRIQVDALNQNNFSVAEYDWARRQIYEAAAIPIPLDLEKTIRDVAAGKEVGEVNYKIAADAPEANRTLVAPFIKELSERAGLAALGL